MLSSDMDGSYLMRAGIVNSIIVIALEIFCY